MSRAVSSAKGRGSCALALGTGQSLHQVWPGVGVRFPKAPFANYGRKFRRYQHSSSSRCFPKPSFQRTFANSIVKLCGLNELSNGG